jgi:chromate transport protein ChrA
MRHRTEGIGLVAAWFGVVLGLIVTKMMNIDEKNNMIAFTGIIIAMGIAFAFLSMTIEKPIVILSTSFIGSFIIVASGALIAGKFSEITSLNSKSLS